MLPEIAGVRQERAARDRRAAAQLVIPAITVDSSRRKDDVGATLVVALFPAAGDHKGRPYSGDVGPKRRARVRSLLPSQFPRGARRGHGPVCKTARRPRPIVLT